MQSLTHSYLRRKSHRREALRDKMAAMRAAKERKRLAWIAENPPAPVMAGRHTYTLTIHDRGAGTMHALDLYVSTRRVNSYRVTVDGKPWKAAISMTRVLASMRRKLAPMRREA